MLSYNLSDFQFNQFKSNNLSIIFMIKYSTQSVVFCLFVCCFFFLQRQLEAARILDAAQDFQYLKLSRETEKKERKAAELRREQRIQVDKFNMQLAKEQQAQ